MKKIFNLRSIAILMATYNGEKFLKEQIDSILSQTNNDWTLYIQDDGSDDRTLNIINEYNDERIVLVDVGLTKQGAGLNFMSLLNLVESDYYMFCDQDDVWLPFKIEVSLKRMQEEIQFQKEGCPIIVHTDRTHVDSELKIIRQSELNPRHVSEKQFDKKMELMKNLQILKIYTIVGGCTMFFNHAVKLASFPFINVRVHDSICVMSCISVGGVISTINQSTMLYRLHSTNTCGVSDKRLLPKFFHLRNTIKKNMKGFYVWKIYGGGSFFTFLYFRMKYFFILRTY